MSNQRKPRRNRQPIDFQSQDLRRLASLLEKRFPERQEDALLEPPSDDEAVFGESLFDRNEFSITCHECRDAAMPCLDEDTDVKKNLARVSMPRLAPIPVHLPRLAPSEVEMPELDPRLARQTVSLRHFSLATRQYMIRFQERCSHFKIEDFSAEIGINKSYYYKILNCERRPSRDTAIAMTVCLGLTVEEAQDYLLLLGDQLNGSIKRDFLILDCIRRGYSVDQTDSVLIHFDSSPLVDT